MIYVTGDTHGTMDIDRFTSENFPEGKTLTKNDYVIICGDFGLVWSNPGSKFYNEEQYWLQWLNNKPWTTLFVDGNHENHELLQNLDMIDMFGSYVGKIASSVFHLRRGQVYNIDGKTIFTMGGAMSTDRQYRIRGVDWWPEEVPSQGEENQAIDNLNKVGNKVDYIISHTGPESAILRWCEWMNELNNDYYFSRAKDSTSKFLQHIHDKVEFKEWFFGHMHSDITIQKNVTIVYNGFIKLN